MKKLFVFALAAATMVGCNSENGEGAKVPGQTDQLRVLTSVSTQTRTAIDGTSFPKGSYIGVQVTKTNDSELMTGASGNGTYEYYADAKNVRFGNEAGVNTWSSIDENNKTHLFLLTGTDVGRARGYYPYTAALEGVGANETSGAKIPVQIQKTGEITVGDENDPSTGSDNNAGTFDDKLAYTAENEIDYMYDDTPQGDTKFNYEVSASSTTTAKLRLAHALSRVSFRMYTSADAKQAVVGDNDSYYELVGYTIKNRTGSTEFCANFDANTKMNIATGKLEGILSGGEISRTIKGYVMKKAQDANDPTDAAIVDAYRVSNLVFPLSQITPDDDNTQISKNIEVVFQIVKVSGTGEKSEPIGYALPFAITAESGSWDRGSNYTYTVKFTGNALSIETVTVTDWVEVIGGDMEIE